MDIQIIGENCIKLRGKKATFIVDPEKGMSKTSADGIILLDSGINIDVTRVTESRIIIAGPGGYEVGGTKISGTKTPKGTFYKIIIDGINIFLGAATDEKLESFNACQVAIINANGEFNVPFVTTLEPKIAILYGAKKAESAKSLGAETVNLLSKITLTKDKLPEKMEIVALGS